MVPSVHVLASCGDRKVSHSLPQQHMFDLYRGWIQASIIDESNLQDKICPYRHSTLRETQTPKPSHTRQEATPANYSTRLHYPQIL